MLPSQPSTQAFPSRLLDLARNFTTCTSRSLEREREGLGTRLFPSYTDGASENQANALWVVTQCRIFCSLILKVELAGKGESGRKRKNNSQRVIIFCNRKSTKRRKPLRKRREPEVKMYGKFCPPVLPPPSPSPRSPSTYNSHTIK